MTLAEIRLKAADLLESRPDAWCQGAFRRRRATGYAYCMIGACREAAGYYTAIDADIAAAAAKAAGEVIDKSEGVSAWNDMPGRTREEVIAALRGVKP